MTDQESGSDNCTFCKIISGDLPSYKIYEDEETIAILDKYPISKGHTLVIPKSHRSDLLSMKMEESVDVMKSLKKVSEAVYEALDTESFNIVQSNGRTAGQEIFHVHFHIIPRYKNEIRINADGYNYTSGEKEEILESVKDNFK